jgi:predicted N-acyltransferase
LGILRRRPLLICKSPVAGAAGLILPADPGLRRAALRTLVEIGQEQARAHRASFLLFTYLGKGRVAGWPAGVVRSLSAGTSMAVAWPHFESYLASLSRWARKSVRQNLRRAEEQGIVVRAHATVTRLDEALHLIRNVERRHDTGENFRARAILQHAGMVEATWMTAEQGSRLVACGLLLGERDTRSMTLLGLDDGVEYGYFTLFYGCIRRAIEELVRVLRGGATTYGFKERLGFEVEDDEYIAFAGRGPFVLAERLAHLFPVG